MFHISFWILINAALESDGLNYLPFNVSAVIAPANEKRDIPKKVSGRSPVVCTRYPARGADKVIPMFWQRVTMLNPVPANCGGRLSADTVMTTGGIMAAAAPKIITDKTSGRLDA
jgi:hypothetical protein